MFPASGEAHIWSVPLQAEQELIDELNQTLSMDERERASRFYSPQLQNSFIISRGLLRAILSAYILVPSADVRFSYAAKGKPYLQDHPSLHFNMAHSGGRAVYAVATDDVGVDIELIKPWRDLQKIGTRFFSPREADELNKMNSETQTRSFFTCWTRKEAYIKATGQGMAIMLAKFYAGTDPSQPHGQIEEDGLPPQWYFNDLKLKDVLKPEDQYAGAVATRSPRLITNLINFQTVKDCLQFIAGQSG